MRREAARGDLPLALGGLVRSAIVRARAILVACAIVGASSRARAGDPPRAIVLVKTAGVPAATWEAAELAIRAQLADLGVRVVEASGGDAEGLRATIDRATKAAGDEHAIGAFWLGADAAGDVLLYLAEPDGARVLVRRVKRASDAAALEEVAIIARASTSALLEGRSIGMEPVAQPEAATPPKPPSPPPLAASPPRPREDASRAAPQSPPLGSFARLGVAYAGESYAPEVMWQSGVALEAAWLVPAGSSLGAPFTRGRMRLGAGVFVAPAIPVDAGEVAFSIARYPFQLELGYEVDLGEIGVGFEVDALVEAATRSTTRVASVLAASPDATRWTAGVAPRARVGWAIRPPLRVEAGLGLEIVPGAPRYVVALPAPEPIVSPSVVRPRVDVGLALEIR